MIDSPVSVLSDAAGNIITSTQDGSARRLQVETRSAGVSSFNLVNTFMANGSNTNMKVVGSAGSPVYFSFAPASGSVTVTRINLLMVATTITFAGNLFGSGLALANGIAASTTVNGTTNISTVLKINEDFLLFALNPTVVQGTAGGLLGAGAVNGVLGLTLTVQQTLNAATSDSIGFSVRDNLAGIANIQYLRSSVQAYVSV